MTPQTATQAATQITAFETGKTYYAHSICDHDTIYSFEILRRTTKTVWVEVHGEVVKRRISTSGGVESFMPFGTYSMAACISADRPIEVDEEAQEEALETPIQAIEEAPERAFMIEPSAPATPAYKVIAEAPVLEPAILTQPKAKPVSVKIARAEGQLAALMTITIEGKYEGESNLLEQANNILRMWALAFPPSGSDKVDFWITFNDDEVYRGTFRLEPQHRLGASLQQHILGHGQHLRGIAFYDAALAKHDEFLARHEVA